MTGLTTSELKMIEVPVSQPAGNVSQKSQK